MKSSLFLFFQRVEGKMFIPMASTICFALAGALVLTLTVIPVLCSLLLKHVRSEQESRVLRWARRLYEPGLQWSLAHPRATIGVVVLLLVASFGVTPWLGSEFLPELDQRDIDRDQANRYGISVSDIQSANWRRRIEWCGADDSRISSARCGAWR